MSTHNDNCAPTRGEEEPNEIHCPPTDGVEPELRPEARHEEGSNDERSSTGFGGSTAEEETDGAAQQSDGQEEGHGTAAPSEDVATGAGGPPDGSEKGISLLSFASAVPPPLEPRRLSDFAITDGLTSSVTKKVLATVPVRKPSKEAFIRTKEATLRHPFVLLELKESDKLFLLSPEVAATLEMSGENAIVKAHLVPTVDRLGNFSLWPLRFSERENPWHLSARVAAGYAECKWVRVLANMTAGQYDVLVAEKCNDEPVWPEEDFETVLQIAFRGRVIEDMDHPALKDLRGDF